MNCVVFRFGTMDMSLLTLQSGFSQRLSDVCDGRVDDDNGVVVGGGTVAVSFGAVALVFAVADMIFKISVLLFLEIIYKLLFGKQQIPILFKLLVFLRWL